MKKSLLALAALTAFAGVASAQSSVTLFGIVDLAARSVKNGNAGSIKSVSPNGQVSSRLGVRGVEDLGGGLRAGFWLEGDLSADDGQAAGQSWQRRSTVSLIGSFGEVRLGRDYNPVFNTFVSHDPFAYVGVASTGNLRSRFYATPVGNAGLAARNNNSISYFLPAMGGLYGQVMIAAPEGARGNKYTGFRLGYAAGPLNFSGAYGKADQTGGMVDDATSLIFGGSFNAGFATFHASYEQADYSTTKRKLATVAAVIPTGTGAFKAQYAKASGATLIGLGYVQGLSKRTSVYTNFGRIANKGNNVYTASPSGPAGMRAGQTSTGYDVGIRHDF
ncbi:porin [Rubrivivax rivuli]|uniref:Porin n=1 Tax=Rubrivivax rivuli TaxID=1862385 RepID=A0A437RKY3_9BURK|nr:porin [Rubrivivax rivuli]RVU47409.1 porin [Rubrivivax rivuli]